MRKNQPKSWCLPIHRACRFPLAPGSDHCHFAGLSFSYIFLSVDWKSLHGPSPNAWQLSVYVTGRTGRPASCVPFLQLLPGMSELLTLGRPSPILTWGSVWKIYKKSEVHELGALFYVPGLTYPHCWGCWVRSHPAALENGHHMYNQQKASMSLDPLSLTSLTHPEWMTGIWEHVPGVMRPHLCCSCVCYIAHPVSIFVCFILNFLLVF